jgi:hypothetical protein
MGVIGAAWISLTSLLAFARLAFPASPIVRWQEAIPVILAYASVIAAPVGGFLIARRAFNAPTQPSLRLAVLGRWQTVSADNARRQPAFGATGFMTSLLVGMLLNVAVRALEFFAAVPAMTDQAPVWGQVMFAVMSTDVAVTGFFYMAAFAMALRTVPLFPRMLLYAWVLDVAMQLIIAQQIALAGQLPQSVVVPLLALLKGNIVKVCISVMVWLPYLLLSRRVNVTYRCRIAS